MKIASLLPSATEIVYALGLGDDLVGVTDECDYPPAAVTKPVISRSALSQGHLQTPAEIDNAVRAKVDTDEPIYQLDVDLLRRTQPDVILTQDLCRVCAVPRRRAPSSSAPSDSAWPWSKTRPSVCPRSGCSPWSGPTHRSRPATGSPG